MKAFDVTKIMLGCLLWISSSALYGQYVVESITHATNGLCNGAIIVTVDPENAPHAYEWTYNGQTFDNNQPIIFNLCAGKYTVFINDGYGCEWVLDAEVLQASGCFLESAQVGSHIKNACKDRKDGRIELLLAQDESYTYTWDNGATGPILNNVAPGEYCVVISDPNAEDCFQHACFEVQEIPDCNITGNGYLIVNEVSNGADGQTEYVELLVLSDGTCNPVDLRGYILDDNNGDFSDETHGICNTGISAGHNRFKHIDQWATVLPGSKIIVYKPSAINPSIILPDDPKDVNGDLVYVLPLSAPYFEGTHQFPSYADPYSYPASATYSTPKWAYMSLNDAKDAMQIRLPNGRYIHGVSYGGDSFMSGGPDDLLITTAAAGDKVIAFQDGFHGSKVNFTVKTADGLSQTPGAANSTANENFITALTCTDPLVIVNEFSYGESASQGFIELLVLGNGNCSSLNLRNYIVDDNNGDFSIALAGSGISSGHLRFPATVAWGSIPAGSLIVIYNPKDRNPNLPAEDDPTDANQDGVYILPVTDLVGRGDAPTQNSADYANTQNLGEAKWAYLEFFNYGDAVQLRYPEGNYCHGLSYGSSGTINGGLDSLMVSGDKAIGNSYIFSDGNPRIVSNFQAVIAPEFETPGAPNNTANEAYITGLCTAASFLQANSRSGSFNPNLTATIYPNPFTDFVSIDLKADEAQEVTVKLVDFMGRVLYERKEGLVKGNNHMLLNFKDQLTDGVYYISIGDNELPLFEEKIIRMKK